jgi:hypothetical protein
MGTKPCRGERGERHEMQLHTRPLARTGAAQPLGHEATGHIYRLRRD